MERKWSRDRAKMMGHADAEHAQFAAAPRRALWMPRRPPIVGCAGQPSARVQRRSPFDQICAGGATPRPPPTGRPTSGPTTASRRSRLPSRAVGVAGQQPELQGRMLCRAVASTRRRGSRPTRETPPRRGGRARGGRIGMHLAATASKSDSPRSAGISARSAAHTPLPRPQDSNAQNHVHKAFPPRQARDDWPTRHGA